MLQIIIMVSKGKCKYGRPLGSSLICFVLFPCTKCDLLHTFSRPSSLNLNSSFSNHELLASVCLVPHQKQTGKKTLSLLWRSLSLLWWHSWTQKCVGRKKQKGSDQQRSKTFWGRVVKTKHQSLTSLTFMWLVPGTDWVPYLHSVYKLSVKCYDPVGDWALYL